MSEPPSDDTDDGTPGASTDDLRTDVLPHASSAWKVLGEITDSDGVGVLGHNTAASGPATGVEGVTDSPDHDAAGVVGRATATTGTAAGVVGRTDSVESTSVGVEGVATSQSSEGAIGIRAISRSTDFFAGPALQALAERAPAIEAIGGEGIDASMSDPSYAAVDGYNGSTTGSTSAIGVDGATDDPKGAGVRGFAFPDSGFAKGVIGRTSSQTGYGVVAKGQLAVERSVAYDGDFRRHAATIENTSGDSNGDVLGLKTNVQSPGTKMNFISFVDPTGQIGQIEGDGGGGVQFTGTVADFAEFFPKADPDRSFAGGQVVGLRDGEAVASVADADAALVVSPAPLVLGNKPIEEADRDDYVELTLVGQVHVRVSGAVESGDVLVASPDDDGTAVARRAVRSVDRPVLGVALAGNDGDDEVLALVGGPGVGARTANGAGRSASETGDEPVDTPERENDRLRERVSELEAENRNLRERLAAVEDRLGVDDVPPAPADD